MNIFGRFLTQIPKYLKVKKKYLGPQIHFTPTLFLRILCGLLSKILLLSSPFFRLQRIRLRHQKSQTFKQTQVCCMLVHLSVAKNLESDLLKDDDAQGNVQSSYIELRNFPFLSTSFTHIQNLVYVDIFLRHWMRSRVANVIQST